MAGKEKTVGVSQLRSFGLLVGGIFAIIGGLASSLKR